MHSESTPVRVKRCTRCGGEKPLTAFSPDRRKANGVQARCKECLAELGRQRYRSNPEAERQRARAWQRANPDRSLESARRWKSENPERVSNQGRRWKAAHHDRHLAANRRWQEANPERVAMSKRAVSIVRQAIKRGELKRPDACSQCGSAGRVQAAHYDYSRPLDVRWLCIPCHRRWDAADPKTKAAIPDAEDAA